MASYVTHIGNAKLLLEAKTSGAFAKSEGEIKADPRQAVVNMVQTTKQVAAYVSSQVGPAVMKSPGLSFELVFGVRADVAGLVMIAETPGEGQFQCRLSFSAPR